LTFVAICDSGSCLAHDLDAPFEPGAICAYAIAVQIVPVGWFRDLIQIA
jgi:hypothetical protein